MELAGIKNIIFDLGGVLLNLDYQLTKDAFIKLGVKDYESHFTQSKQATLFDAYETGQLSEADFHVQLKALTGINSSKEEILTAWNAMLLDFPIGRKQLLLNLKEHFNTSLLSNTNETHVNGFTKIIKQDIGLDSLDPLFHSTYFSNDIGIRKPDVAAFNFVLEENNYDPRETLFIDDTLQHVEGAKQCGIQAIHLQEKTVEELFSDFLT